MVDYIVSFSEWLQAHPQISGLVFMLVFAAILAVGVPGGNLLMLTSGMLFGTLVGATLAVCGGVLAATATHFFIRSAFGRWLDQRAGHQREAVRDFVGSGNWLLLVVPRLIPVIPFFVVNVSLTAAGVQKKHFLLSTLIGLIPIALLFSHLGSELGDARAITGTRMTDLLLSPTFLGPIAGLLVLALSGWAWIRNHQKA